MAWLKKQVESFSAVRPAYMTYAATLESILEKARDRYAPTGRVDSRAKTTGSFAEKALRKREKYDRPLEKMTDLAGARIIVHTLEEVRKCCRFIENEPGFRIDWGNSLNMQQQLKTEMFGYNAVHYVVELFSQNILGVKIPAEIQSVQGKRSYKAEIQIQTVLQNAWSAIGHDRLYKTMVRVPASLKREIHSVAAVLESADKAFDRSVELLDHYIRNFQAYKPPAELQEDIDMWRTITAEAPRDKSALHQLGLRLMAAQRWTEAKTALSRLKDEPNPEMQRTLGESTWRADKRAGKAARAQLEKALELNPRDFRAKCVLAETYGGTEPDKAISHYEEAFELAPNEPAVLVPLVECHIIKDRSLEKLKLMKGMLGGVLHHCHERAIRGVYLPQAHFNCARIHLYQGRKYAALNSYAIAVSVCHMPGMITDEINSLTEITHALGGNEHPDRILETEEADGFEWARRMLVVALSAKAASWLDKKNEPGAEKWLEAGKAVRPELESLGTPNLKPKSKFSLPVVIVAGSCDPRFSRDLVEKYGRLFRKAFESFSGTIISGGTTSGISGMAARLRPSCERRISRVAYLPLSRPLPHGDKQSSAYEIREAPGIGYSPAGVLRAWADILIQGLKPEQVRIFAINGGVLTGFELRMGLAIGAVAGAAENSGRIVNTLLEVQTPCRPEGLVPLPPDATTWAAFLRGASPELNRIPEKHLEPAARKVHEQFRRDCENNPEKHDPSVFSWKKLPETYKESNRHQVRFASLLLDAAGFDVVPAGKDEKLDSDNPPVPDGFLKKISAMAELEHGRFCAERLVEGWRRGTVKDLDRRINPTIVPWKELKESIKNYDYLAARNFPKWLAAAGLKIVEREP